MVVIALKFFAVYRMRKGTTVLASVNVSYNTTLFKGFRCYLDIYKYHIYIVTGFIIIPLLFIPLLKILETKSAFCYDSVLWPTCINVHQITGNGLLFQMLSNLLICEINEFCDFYDYKAGL